MLFITSKTIFIKLRRLWKSLVINVSKTKLSNDFKKQVGKTLNEYLNDEKLNEAKLLLKYSDESIVNISLFLNYSSQSYFNNKFKNKFNITPNDFRKKYK